MSKFVFHELHTGDAAAAQKFYKGVFGWSYDSVPMPNGAYIFIKSDGDGIGGIVQHEDGHPPHWLTYVGVASVKRTMGKATRRGAEVVMGYTKVPNMGALAILKDPTGAVFAVWEEARKAAPAKKAATKKAAAKKVSKKKATAKKRTTKKAAAKKTTKKAAAKKRTTKKAAAKKTTKKAAAKKRTTKKAAAKKTTKKAAAKKRTTKKAAAKKRPAKKTTRRGKRTAKK